MFNKHYGDFQLIVMFRLPGGLQTIKKNIRVRPPVSEKDAFKRNNILAP